MASLTLELLTPKLGALMSELQLLIQSAAQHPPDKLLCFDLLTKLLATIDNEPKVRNHVRTRSELLFIGRKLLNDFLSSRSRPYFPPRHLQANVTVAVYSGASLAVRYKVHCTSIPD